MFPGQFLTLLVVAVSLTLGQLISRNEFDRLRLEAASSKRIFRQATGAGVPKPDLLKKSIAFSNPRASEFWVDGSAIPEVDFDVGDSWAGLLPISSAADETRKLFFWFFPPGPEGSLDDLIFWTNGGPGCSSLEGLFKEHGPFLLPLASETGKPIVNVHSWTNLSSILYVEQPVGTGYSQGEPNIKDEDDLAAQLVGFFQQFLEVFSELKGNKFWLTGESYAGMYVPYLANYIYENPNLLDLSLQGIWLADPSIGLPLVQIQIPALPFVYKHKHVFSFTPSLLRLLDQLSDACNYTGYSETWATYPPPKGPFPSPGENIESRPECDLWHFIINIALTINPYFNIYAIFDPLPEFDDDFVSTDIYFNRPDVKEAIHAPLNEEWSKCKLDHGVFVGERDNSLPSAFTVLPNVIEKSKRSVIVHGLGDFVLIAEGTRIVMQNMTWGGHQGFQTPIPHDNFIVNSRSVGHTHTERGLTYFEIHHSGHMVPRYAPVAAFQTMQYLMGFRELPDVPVVLSSRDEL